MESVRCTGWKELFTKSQSRSWLSCRSATIRHMVNCCSCILSVVLVTGNPGGKLLPEHEGPRHGVSDGASGLLGHRPQGVGVNRPFWKAPGEDVGRGLSELELGANVWNEKNV